MASPLILIQITDVAATYDPRIASSHNTWSAFDTVPSWSTTGVAVPQTWSVFVTNSSWETR